MKTYSNNDLDTIKKQYYAIREAYNLEAANEYLSQILSGVLNFINILKINKEK